MMRDTLLISAHKSGDENAMRALMDRYRDTLMGFLVNRVGIDAEDLYQETWTRVSTHIHSYNDQGSFRAWLFQIARRLVIDHHRRATVRIKLVSADDEVAPSMADFTSPEQQLTAAQIADVFEHTLSTMDPMVAEVVRWRLIENVPFNEIAERQRVPLNTCLGRMHRALNQIRKALHDAQLINTERKV